MLRGVPPFRRSVRCWKEEEEEEEARKPQHRSPPPPPLSLLCPTPAHSFSRLWKCGGAKSDKLVGKGEGGRPGWQKGRRRSANFHLPDTNKFFIPLLPFKSQYTRYTGRRDERPKVAMHTHVHTLWIGETDERGGNAFTHCKERLFLGDSGERRSREREQKTTSNRAPPSPPPPFPSPPPSPLSFPFSPSL